MDKENEKFLLEEFEKNEDVRRRAKHAHDKYIKPILDRETADKKRKRKEWIQSTALPVSTLVVSVLTLIATLIFGLQSALR